jgi:hypothetical protein
MTKYINEENNFVPDNKIVFMRTNRHTGDKYDISEIIEPLSGNTKRDWFVSHFYRCLPLTIANQYGFILKSAYDMTLYWSGRESDAVVVQMTGANPNGQKGTEHIQNVFTNFESGVVSIENFCTLRTPPGINLMTIQPPNMINNPDLFVMSGVVEADNLRRTFTFNVRVLNEKKKIKIKKGDPLAAFIPIPRYFVDNFELMDGTKYFDEETLNSEWDAVDQLEWERNHIDPVMDTNGAGRRYLRGIFPDGSSFPDHQRKVPQEPGEEENDS